MAKIRFENGVVVNFNGNPTPQDIEEVAQKLGISKKKSSFGQDIKESFKLRTDKLSESYLRQQQGKQSVGESILQTVGQGAGLIGDVAFSGVSRLASAITPDAIEKPAVEASKKLITKAVSTPLVSGAVSKYQKFAEEQPRAAANIGAVGNIASMIPVGKAGSVAGKVVGKTALNTAKIVGKAGEQVATKGANLSKFGISQASGLNRETIEQIIKNPQMFTKEVVGDMTRENIGKQIKTGITNRINQLQSVGKEYEPLRKLNKVINVPAETYTDAINKYGLKLSGGKLIATAESKPFLSGELKQIEDFISQYASTKHTPNSALNAREALSSLAKFDTGKSNNLTSLAKDLRVNLNKIIQDDKVGIPGIKSIDDYYSKEIKLLKDIRKDYFIKGTTDFKDNALSKIANLTKEGRQSVLKRLKEIDPNIDFKVNILRAVEDIKSSGGLKVGTYARGGIAAGGLATGNIPLLLGALAAQPEILVPVLRAWGNLRASQKAIVKSIETKLKSGADLLLNEKSALNQAINSYAKKIGEKTKNIKPGLTIEDVSPKAKGEILKSTQYKSALEALRSPEMKAKLKVVESQMPKKVTKTSNNLYHSTSAENLDSIIKGGLKTGQKPKFEGVSSPNKISFSANEEAAKYYGGDVMIRTKTSYKPTDIELDLLAGGEGTYVTGKNIPPEMLEIKVGSKWIPLTDYKKLPLKSTPLVSKEVSNFIKKAYQEAPLAKKEIDTTANIIAKKYDGIVAKAPLKKQEKVLFNIKNKYNGDFGRVSDIARNTIIVSPEDAPKVFKELQKNPNYFSGKFVDPKTDPLGYSGYNTKYRASNGHIAEIQINTPEMIYAKEPADSAITQLGKELYNKLNKQYNGTGGKGHKYYDAWSKSLEELNFKLADKIAKESSAYYKPFIK